MSRARIQQSSYLIDRAGAALGVSYHYDKEDGGPAADLVGAALTHCDIEGMLDNVGKGKVIYKLSHSPPVGDPIGIWNAEEASTRLNRLGLAADETIETAANIALTRELGYPGEDAVRRLEQRRRAIMDATRVKNARALLGDLGLEPYGRGSRTEPRQ